tara:strand:+ start:222 stop:923 length:702 start_codon:yes stop_codon:yes gene_type:complete
MARSCTYITKNGLKEDEVCFSTFNSTTRSTAELQIIVIEKDKGPFELKVKKRFLRHLKCMGFNFTYRTLKNGNIHIDTTGISELKNHSYKVLFGMLVRFLWEGSKPGPEDYYGVNYDSFYKVTELYFNLLKVKRRDNKFRLLMIACNIFTCTGYGLNSNHFLTAIRICPLFTKIPIGPLQEHKSVNYSFKGNENYKMKLVAYLTKIGHKPSNKNNMPTKAQFKEIYELSKKYF